MEAAEIQTSSLGQKGYLAVFIAPFLRILILRKSQKQRNKSKTSVSQSVLDSKKKNQKKNIMAR